MKNINSKLAILAIFEIIKGDEFLSKKDKKRVVRAWHDMFLDGRK